VLAPGSMLSLSSSVVMTLATEPMNALPMLSSARLYQLLRGSVDEDNENGLVRLSGSRRNTDPLGKGHEFRQGPNLHFLHHPVAMDLDGTFGTA
jgi:hypothetical protein